MESNYEAIFVLTQDSCPQCEMAKNFFKEKGVCINEIDVDSERGQKWVDILNANKLPCVWTMIVNEIENGIVHKIAQGYEEVLKVYG